MALVFAGIATLSTLTASDQAKAVRHTNDLDLINVGCGFATDGPRLIGSGSPGCGEALRDDLPDVGVDAEPEVRAVDLEVLDPR